MKPNTFKIAFLLVLFSAIGAISAFGETRAFEREYTYQASENDSRNSCRAVALQEVKKLLLEEIGAYLESRTEVRDFRLSHDEVVLFTAGVVSTEILLEKWDGHIYYLKVRIAADPDEVIRSIDRLRKDVERTRELEEMRKSFQTLLAENEKLKGELKQAKDQDKQPILAAYEKNINAMNAFEWFEHGYASDIAGNCREAIKSYSKAIRLDPDYAAAYNNRGKCYGRTGMHEQAIRDFERALALRPGLATVHYNRGNAYNRIGDLRKAIADFNSAVALDPALAIAYNNRGNVYVRLGDYRRALTDFDRAIAIDPGFTKAYYNRANAYDKLGDRSRAVADLVRAARQGHQNAARTLRNRGIAF